MKKLRPRQIAKEWGIRVATVLAWIRSGELPAIDVSAKPGVSKPRFLVDRAELEAFERRRSVRPPQQKRRRRPQPRDVIQFV